MIKSDKYRVPCIANQIKNKEALNVSVPGSKSITNRALLIATMADGISNLNDVLFSDDSRHFLKCIIELGFETIIDEENKTVTVKGLGGLPPKTHASIYVGSAGTAARFLAAYLGVSEGQYHLDASAQMRKRPMAPLLGSLKELGCKISFDEELNHFPFTLESNGFATDSISINIDHSSQFLSALLIASCLSQKNLHINVCGSHGLSYIEITRRMMEQFGVKAIPEYDDDDRTLKGYTIAAGQTYIAGNYQIEPDVSAACYFYAMSPLLNIPVMVNHVHENSMQGDLYFIKIMETIGCTSVKTPDGILLLPPKDRSYPGIDVNMSCCSDQAITLAALAPFATSATTIRGIGHIAFQECNRMNAIVTELSRMGIRCEQDTDSITIFPGTPTPCTVKTYDDHRMAMGFSLIGLRADGIIIDDPACCRKTFEDFFEVLDDAIVSLLKE